MNLWNKPNNGNGRAAVTVLSPVTFGPDDNRRRQAHQGLQAEVRRQLEKVGEIREPRLILDLPVIGQAVALCYGVPFQGNRDDLIIHVQEAAPATTTPRSEKVGGNDFFSEVRALPEASFDTFWSRIHLPGDLKERLVRAFQARMSLAERGLDTFSLAGSGTILLEGPPGTGKTSIARGVAQQVALRTRRPVRFVQLDAHRLSDEMLGKGPKLVEHAFRQVQQWALEMPTFLLLDEVESLMTCRRLASRDGNPVDAFRSVNAAIQCLDQGAAHHQLMVLCTSNLPDNIDPAFLSRMDLRLEVGLPDSAARQAILDDTLDALQRALNSGGDNHPPEDLIAATEGMSGRQLRKLVLEALLDLDDPTSADLDALLKRALHHARNWKTKED